MKKLIALFTALILVLGCAALSSAEETVEVLSFDILDEDTAVCYSSVVEGFVHAIQDYNDPEVPLTDEEREELRADYLLTLDCGKIGYAIADLDGNGIPELIVGTVTDDPYFAKLILGVYTMKDGEAVTVLESGERDQYRWIGGNRFAELGSSGADDSVDTILALNGAELEDLGEAAPEEAALQFPLEYIEIPGFDA